MPGAFIRVKLLSFDPPGDHSGIYWNPDDAFVAVKIKDAARSGMFFTFAMIFYSANY